MKNELITILLLLILIAIFALFGNFLFRGLNSQKLTSPNGKTILPQISKQTFTPTLTPAPTPIIFHFDKSTNLQTELDSINPQVKDSDFDTLKTITTSL